MRINRRRRVPRARVFGRLLRGRGNRRIKVRQAPRRTAPSPPKRQRDYRALARRVGRSAYRALKPTCVVLVAVVAGLGGYWGYRHAAASMYFTVKRIEIGGTRRVPPEQLRRLLASLPGRGIFRVDLREAAQAVRSHPWVREAEAQRRLPDAITIQVAEQRAAAALHLGHLYLVNEAGEVFKRAEPAELEGLAVISGISRHRYLADVAAARAEIVRGLAVIAEYRRARRPPLSELSLGPDGEITLFLRRGGVALRFGARFGEEPLKRLDAVLSALGPDLRRVRSVYLDHESHPERVVVRMVSN